MAKQKSKNETLTQEELQQIEQVKENKSKMMYELGEIKLLELNVEKRLDNAEKLLEQVGAQETELAKYLEAKYGRGTINTDSGEFVPTK